MSSPLAIAAVTWVLKDLLNEGLINSDLTTQVKVTAKPPIAEPKVSSGDESQLNLFLYHVSWNPGWRNAGLPAFDGGGARVGNPPLALDLHYLLTAYDERDLHAEVLLGYALQLLHETPVLTRQAIRASLKIDLVNAPGAQPLPDDLRSLTTSGLADQIELIKVTPHPFGIEEMSKLWTGFQAPYRPSVAYLVTVVLIESAKPARAALPVVKVGSDARGPAVQASMLPPFPTLLAVRAPDYQPAARIGETIHLLGHHLTGTSAVAVLKHPGLDLELTLPLGDADFTAPPTRAALRDGAETFDVPDDVLQLADSRIKVNLSLAVLAADWAPGVWSVELRVTRPGDASPRTSNSVALAVAPVILLSGADAPQITAAASVNQRRQTTVTLKCQPKVRQGQAVSLIIGDRELAGAPVFVAPATVTDTLKFEGALPAGMFPGPYPIRLRVDGVESLFIRRFLPQKPPEFDPTQVVTLPP